MTPASGCQTPGLTFDAPSHTYHLDGWRLPSVTQILEASGMVDGAAYFTDEGRDRGRAVHRIIELEAAGDLDEATIDERLMGYVEAHRAFVRECDWVSCHTELRLASARWGFAGALDDLGFMRDTLGVLDYKSGNRARHHEAQLAAYRMLLKENAGRFGLDDGEIDELPMTVVRLQQDGKYKLYPVTAGESARAAFLAALTIHRFMGRE